MTYGIKVETDLSFNDAVETVKKLLAEEQFGVLTEIDVKKTLKTKLDVNTEDYLILGACNPPFAYEALKAEDDIGLLLPCNVIVYRKNGKTIVNAIKPSIAMSMVDNPSLGALAHAVESKLSSVISKLG